MLNKFYLCLLNRRPLSVPQIVISDSHFNENSSTRKLNTFTLKKLKFECVCKTLYNFIKFDDETTLRCYQRGVCCVIRRSLLGECCAEAPQGAWKNKLFIYCHKIGCGGWGCTLTTGKLSLHQRVFIRIAIYTLVWISWYPVGVGFFFSSSLCHLKHFLFFPRMTQTHTVT